MKQFLLVLLGLAAWVASAGAQKASSPEPYLWPTDASTHLTSTFCEFRPRHYHAAIDIKTWNKTGYRIFAIDDGYVYRIRIGATGYGKAVYLKLRDGRIVVYAHLSGFNEPLTRVTDSLRMAARKNRLDWFPRPGQFPVKRGQLLGYTGETGIGVPHLHFELRDARNRPINPLPFYRHTIADRIPPGVTRLAIIPVCAASAVQFKPDTLFLNLPVQQTLSLDQPIYLTGRAYLAAQTFDRADGVNNRLDFYRASLWANDSLIYQVQYDRFSYQTTRYVEVDKNFSLWRRGLGIFHNFFRHPANRLAFYGPTPPGGGLLDARSLRPGANRLRLEVADFFGNTTTLTLTVVYLPNRPLRLYTATRLNRDLLLGVVTPDSVKKLTANWLAFNPHQKTLPARVDPLAVKPVLERYYTTFTVPLPENDGGWWLQLKAEDDRGVPFLPLLVGPWSEAAGLSRYQFRATALGLWGSGRLTLHRPGWLQLSLGPDRWYLGAPAAQGLTDTTLQVLFPDSLRRELGQWQLVTPQSSLTFHSEDSLMEVEFFPGSVYDSLYCRIKKRPPHGPFPPQAKVCSPVYQIQPFDQPLNQGVWLRLHLPDSLQRRKGLGIYYWDRKKGWLYLPHAPERWQAKITSLEQFILLQDTLPPMLAPIQTRIGAKKGAPGLRFRILDSCAGIYDEDQITVKINGRWTPFDYDPEEKELLVPQRFVPLGRSEVEILATDNVGNTAHLAVPAFRF